MAKAKPKARTDVKPDASLDAVLNGVRIQSKRTADIQSKWTADKLRGTLGETVAWAVAFPRGG
jgi:hypothetical protein